MRTRRNSTPTRSSQKSTIACGTRSFDSVTQRAPREPRNWYPRGSSHRDASTRRLALRCHSRGGPCPAGITACPDCVTAEEGSHDTIILELEEWLGPIVSGNRHLQCASP